MQELIIYMLKMTGCSAVLLLYYYLFLRDKKFHQYNRFYLLMSVVISFILPLVHIPVSWQGEAHDAPLYIQTLDVITVDTIVTGSAHSSSIETWLMPAYLFISVIVLLALFISVSKVYSVTRKYPAEQTGNIFFYNTEEKDAPYSFMNKIFWSKGLDVNSEKGQLVFRHELYHVMHLHSADLVFMQLVLALAWVNPFFYIIKKELATIHEFLADQFAVSENDHYSYAEFLVINAMKQTDKNLITHQFFNSPLKRRIAMILPDNENNRLSYAARIMSIPLVIVLFCSLALKAEIKVAEMISASEELVTKATDTPAVVMDTVIKPKPKPKPKAASKPKPPKVNLDKFTLKRDTARVINKNEPTFTRVEIEPEYPGGLTAWRQYLNKTFRYPGEAVDNEIQGPVVVQFIVDKDGSISNIKAVSGPDTGGLREEAERVVKLSGKWIPAIQNGHMVRAYKKQTITFVLEPSQ